MALFGVLEMSVLRDALGYAMHVNSPQVGLMYSSG